MAEVIDRELGWDDEISHEGSNFVILPDGEYDFTVTGFTRARHNGSEKLPPCNKAVVSVKITSPAGEATLTHNLFLHSKCEGLLSDFFISIGLKKHGEPLRMNWNLVTGKKGRLKLGTRTWKNKNGEEMKSNEILRFLDPVDGQLAAAKTFTPGSF